MALWKLAISDHRAFLAKYRLYRCEVMPCGIVKFCASASSDMKYNAYD